MKLIVTADDFGFTQAVADGIIFAATEGVLTETGLFSNMPYAEKSARRLERDAPHVCLGEDINLVAGRPVSDPKRIPSLVHEDGTFIKSAEHRQADIERPNHIPYEEAYIETEAQINRFIEIVGKKPAYFQGHSYGTTETYRAFQDVAKKYDVPILAEVLKEHGIASGPEISPWCKVKLNEDKTYDFTMEDQLSRNPLGMFKRGELLINRLVDESDALGHIHTHAGFVDKELVRNSSYTMIRAVETDFLTSPELKDWVAEHDVELISIRDLL